jgi:protein-tyrosine phosphatase
VVCHGNICRSPFAAAVLARHLPDVQVTSAGFIGPGRQSPAEAIAAAAEHGVDLSPHRSRVLVADTVRSAEMIVTMDVTQRREILERFGRAERDLLLLGDFDPEAADGRTIRDPVSQPLSVFEEVYARIVRCAIGLERALAPSRGVLER